MEVKLLIGRRNLKSVYKKNMEGRRRKEKFIELKEGKRGNGRNGGNINHEGNLNSGLKEV